MSAGVPPVRRSQGPAGTPVGVVEEFLDELLGLRLQGAIEFPVDRLDAGDRGVESLPIPGRMFEPAPVAIDELGGLIGV